MNRTQIYSRVQLHLASPDIIRSWTHRSAYQHYTLPAHRIDNAEVVRGSTYDYKNLKPTTGGLFCETIFGMLKDRSDRRNQLGLIKLASPVMHVWYLKGHRASYASLLVNRPRPVMEDFVYARVTTPHNRAAFDQPRYVSWDGVGGPYGPPKLRQDHKFDGSDVRNRGRPKARRVLRRRTSRRGGSTVTTEQPDLGGATGTPWAPGRDDDEPQLDGPQSHDPRPHHIVSLIEVGRGVVGITTQSTLIPPIVSLTGYGTKANGGRLGPNMTAPPTSYTTGTTPDDPRLRRNRNLRLWRHDHRRHEFDQPCHHTVSLMSYQATSRLLLGCVFAVDPCQRDYDRPTKRRVRAERRKIYEANRLYCLVFGTKAERKKAYASCRRDIDRFIPSWSIRCKPNGQLCYALSRSPTRARPKRIGPRTRMVTDPIGSWISTVTLTWSAQRGHRSRWPSTWPVRPVAHRLGPRYVARIWQKLDRSQAQPGDPPGPKPNGSDRNAVGNAPDHRRRCRNALVGLGNVRPYDEFHPDPSQSNAPPTVAGLDVIHGKGAVDDGCVGSGGGPGFNYGGNHRIRQHTNALRRRQLWTGFRRAFDHAPNHALSLGSAPTHHAVGRRPNPGLHPPMASLRGQPRWFLRSLPYNRDRGGDPPTRPGLGSPNAIDGRVPFGGVGLVNGGRSVGPSGYFELPVTLMDEKARDGLTTVHACYITTRRNLTPTDRRMRLMVWASLPCRIDRALERLRCQYVYRGLSRRYYGQWLIGFFDRWLTLWGSSVLGRRPTDQKLKIQPDQHNRRSAQVSREIQCDRAFFHRWVGNPLPAPGPLELEKAFEKRWSRFERWLIQKRAQIQQRLVQPPPDLIEPPSNLASKVDDVIDWPEDPVDTPDDLGWPLDVRDNDDQDPDRRPDRCAHEDTQDPVRRWLDDRGGTRWVGTFGSSSSMGWLPIEPPQRLGQHVNRCLGYHLGQRGGHRGVNIDRVRRIQALIPGLNGYGEPLTDGRQSWPERSLTLQAWSWGLVVDSTLPRLFHKHNQAVAQIRDLESRARDGHEIALAWRIAYDWSANWASGHEGRCLERVFGQAYKLEAILGGRRGFGLTERLDPSRALRLSQTLVNRPNTPCRTRTLDHAALWNGYADRQKALRLVRRFKDAQLELIADRLHPGHCDRRALDYQQRHLTEPGRALEQQHDQRWQRLRILYHHARPYRLAHRLGLQHYADRLNRRYSQERLGLLRHWRHLWRKRASTDPNRKPPWRGLAVWIRRPEFQDPEYITDLLEDLSQERWRRSPLRRKGVRQRPVTELPPTFLRGAYLSGSGSRAQWLHWQSVVLFLRHNHRQMRSLRQYGSRIGVYGLRHQDPNSAGGVPSGWGAITSSPSIADTYAMAVLRHGPLCKMAPKHYTHIPVTSRNPGAVGVRAQPYHPLAYRRAIRRLERQYDAWLRMAQFRSYLKGRCQHPTGILGPTSGRIDVVATFSDMVRGRWAARGIGDQRPALQRQTAGPGGPHRGYGLLVHGRIRSPKTTPWVYWAGQWSTLASDPGFHMGLGAPVGMGLGAPVGLRRPRSPRLTLVTLHAWTQTPAIDQRLAAGRVRPSWRRVNDPVDVGQVAWRWVILAQRQAMAVEKRPHPTRIGHYASRRWSPPRQPQPRRAKGSAKWRSEGWSKHRSGTTRIPGPWIPAPPRVCRTPDAHGVLTKSRPNARPEPGSPGSYQPNAKADRGPTNRTTRNTRARSQFRNVTAWLPILCHPVNPAGTLGRVGPVRVARRHRSSTLASRPSWWPYESPMRLSRSLRPSLRAIRDRRRRRALVTIGHGLKRDAIRVTNRYGVTPDLYGLPDDRAYRRWHDLFGPLVPHGDHVNASYTSRGLTYPNSATGTSVIQARLYAYADNAESLRDRHESVRRFGLRLNRLITSKRNNRVYDHRMSNRTMQSGAVDATGPAHPSRHTDLETYRQNRKRRPRLRRYRHGRRRFSRMERVITPYVGSDINPGWMALRLLAVTPPDIRPMVALDGGMMAVSDLNKFYQIVLSRRRRQVQAYRARPDYGYGGRVYLYHGVCDRVTAQGHVRFAQCLTQYAVDNLMENGKAGARPLTATNDRPLKSLSDNLKGKRGRFRQNLLGKRVDYSGRSVIVSGPTLRLHECGLPVGLALTLYHNHLLRKLWQSVGAITYPRAVAWIRSRHPRVMRALRCLVESRPILLNRAPTLHRLGFQAFKPVLVSGQALHLHPLVCSAFNADFDGDQMAVHLPLAPECNAEAWGLMWSCNHLYSVATGGNLLLPSQDMVLGSYALTSWDRLSRWRDLTTRVTSIDVNESTPNALDLDDDTMHRVIWLRRDPPYEFGRPQPTFELQLDACGLVRRLHPDMKSTFGLNGSGSVWIKTTVGRSLAHQRLTVVNGR